MTKECKTIVYLTSLIRAKRVFAQMEVNNITLAIREQKGAVRN